MKKVFLQRKSMLSIFLILIMVLSSSSLAFATSQNELDEAIKDTGKFMYETVKSPQVGSIGGEWAVLGLARSGYEVPKEYYNNYYNTVEEYVKACKGNLHDKKYTEYSRLIVALSSIGKDARNVAGYDLTKALGDYDNTIWQGLNGPIWALIALDSANYPMPINKEAKTQATRDMYIKRILECQLNDGGWSLFGGTSHAKPNEVSDPDITGMALQALAKYQDRPEVKKASEEALACMSKQQNGKGGYSSWGSENSESCVQMIVALCELGIPLDDTRFVKNDKTMLDNLMTFYVKGNGFLHTKDGDGSNQMAAEQGFYGLVAADRLAKGKNSLYRMSDSLKIEQAGKKEETDLKNSNLKAIITVPKVTIADKTFDDVKSHKNKVAIEALAARQIINGKTDKLFAPDDTMTRAEFATIVVKALGLEAKANDKFTDVKGNAWYAAYVGTANEQGIVMGKSTESFDPQGTITHQEAAIMVSRAAKLCALEKNNDNGEALKTPIKRCEIAQMLFDMLTEAKLV